MFSLIEEYKVMLTCSHIIVRDDTQVDKSKGFSRIHKCYKVTQFLFWIPVCVIIK